MNLLPPRQNSFVGILFFPNFAGVKQHVFIGLLLLLVLSACHSPQREARHMVSRAERLFDTLPDSTASLIDSVLRMPVYFNEKRRMDMALLQAEALMGDRGQEIPPLMDDNFFDDKPFFSTSPELERAAEYYAKKKKYAKAAHAALYSGFVQQHYNDKAAAMLSFKEAEHYGKLVKDSLTVARAEYRMGRMLYYDCMNQEALTILKESAFGFGNHLAEKALSENMMAVCHLVLGDFENAEICLQQSLSYARKNYAAKVKRKALNNYAVLFQLQGKYDQAIDCLRQINKESNLDDTELLLLNLNLGDVFFDEGTLDSADLFYKNVDSLLPIVHVKIETKASAYDALSQFAESQSNNTSALEYRKLYESLLYDVMTMHKEQAVFQVQRRYDYETLQNTMNHKIIQRHRIILVISLLLFTATVIITVLQYRHKQMMEAEKEMKSLIDSMKADLRQTVKSSVMDGEMAYRLRMILAANRAAKRAKDIQNEWGDLVNQVMNGKETMFDAARAIIERVYPNLYSVLMEKYPNLTETEAKICLLSFCDISNTEIADLLGLQTTTINQNRSSLRKKLNLKPEKMKDQLRKALI